MPPQPIYTPERVPCPAYQLRFSWSCWPSGLTRARVPTEEFFRDLDAKWEADGIRRLESKWSPELIQVTVSLKPHVNPALLAGRLKGRLDHALRKAGAPAKFSRKVSVRSLGDATRAAVEQYVRKQIPKARYADPRTHALLSQFTVRNPDVRSVRPHRDQQRALLVQSPSGTGDERTPRVFRRALLGEDPRWVFQDRREEIAPDLDGVRRSGSSARDAARKHRAFPPRHSPGLHEQSGVSTRVGGRYGSSATMWGRLGNTTCGAYGERSWRACASCRTSRQGAKAVSRRVTVASQPVLPAGRAGRGPRPCHAG